MRKPISDPNKPSKLKGKNFRMGVCSVDHSLFQELYEGISAIEGPWGGNSVKWMLFDGAS